MSQSDALNEALRYIESAKKFAEVHCPNLCGDFSAIKMCIDIALRAAPPTTKPSSESFDDKARRAGLHGWPFSSPQPSSDARAFLNEIANDIEALHEPSRITDKIRAFVRNDTQRSDDVDDPFCWYRVTRDITDEYVTVYSEAENCPGPDWKPLYERRLALSERSTNAAPQQVPESARPGGAVEPHRSTTLATPAAGAAPQPASEAGAQAIFDNWSAYLRPVDREDFRQQLHALLRSDGGTAKVPEGWQLAPKRATMEMQNAGAGAYFLTDSVSEAYRSMLAVAPSPDSQQQEEDSDAVAQ